MGKEKDIALVYMVAGISSRFQGKIKQFAEVRDGETLIEYSLKQALPAGFSKIVFVVGRKTEQPFREKLGNKYKGIPIFYALQEYDEEKRDKPWGTVDALCSAKTLLTEPFVVCNGDDIYGKNSFKILAEGLKNNENAAIGYRLGDVMPEEGKVNRGIFQTRDNYTEKIIEAFGIEKSRLSEKNLNEDDLCSMNIFALLPGILEMLNSRIEEFKKENMGDRKAECLLPNEISRLIENKQMKMKVYPASDKWCGVTNPGDEILVRRALEKEG